MKYITVTVNDNKLDVFDDGRIRRCEYTSSAGYTCGGRFAKINPRGCGRLYVALKSPESGKTKNVLASRIVAMAFLSDYSEDLCVAHHDLNQQNNNARNLKMIRASDISSFCNSPVRRKVKQ